MSFRDVANGVAAGISTAVLTGVVYGVVDTAIEEITKPRADIALLLLWLVAATASFAAVLGSVPAALVICLTRARYHPWRAVPVLVLGATASLLLLDRLLAILPPDVPPPIVSFTVVTLVPTIGGIVATRFLPRSPTRGNPHEPTDATSF